jgi:hypothetical protein
LEIRSTLALSTSIPLWETTCPKTIHCFTMKWHFSQFRTKFFSLHHTNTKVRWCRHINRNTQPHQHKIFVKEGENLDTKENFFRTTKSRISLRRILQGQETLTTLSNILDSLCRPVFRSPHLPGSLPRSSSHRLDFS